MDRVPMTGKEAIGWCQASAAIQAEIATLAALPVVKEPVSEEKPA